MSPEVAWALYGVIVLAWAGCILRCMWLSRPPYGDGRFERGAKWQTAYNVLAGVVCLWAIVVTLAMQS